VRWPCDDIFGKSISGTLNGYFMTGSLSESRHRQYIVTLLIGCGLLQATGHGLDLLETPVLAALLIIGLGAPHGALDVAVAKQRFDMSGPFAISTFVAKYVGLALLVVVLWWQLPSIALAAFLCLAAYHFGGDWGAPSDHAARFVAGAALLSATTIFHLQQVIEIFGWLAPHGDAVLIGDLLQILVWPLFVATAILARYFRNEPEGVVELSVVITCAGLLPPITFFVLYFCGLHSVRHLAAVRHELGRHSIADLVSEALPYVLVAITGSLAGSLLFLHLDAGPAVLSAVFISLAALTVPHMLLFVSRGTR
jgi:beta-carotene 15,15'-dioxygenase